MLAEAAIVAGYVAILMEQVDWETERVTVDVVDVAV